MAAPVERVPSDDWGWHASPDESDDESPQMSSSSSDDQGNSSDTAATRGTSTSSSTAGLAELNSWLYDSCEMGVAAGQQALERAGIKSNLGWSYGLEALEMGSLMKALP